MRHFQRVYALKFLVDKAPFPWCSPSITLFCPLCTLLPEATRWLSLAGIFRATRHKNRKKSIPRNCLSSAAATQRAPHRLLHGHQFWYYILTYKHTIYNTVYIENKSAHLPRVIGVQVGAGVGVRFRFRFRFSVRFRIQMRASRRAVSLLMVY